MQAPITTASTGIAPYGLEQHVYHLNGGAETYDFEAVVRQVGGRRCQVLEAAIMAQANALEQRRAKLEATGEAVAFCSEVLAEVAGDDPKTDTLLYRDGFSDVVKTLERYDLSGISDFTYNSKKNCYGIEYGDLQLVYESLAYAIESENSTLQREMIDLESLISKRDNAYEQTGSFTQKIRTTIAETLQHL